MNVLHLKLIQVNSTNVLTNAFLMYFQTWEKITKHHFVKMITITNNAYLTTFGTKMLDTIVKNLVPLKNTLVKPYLNSPYISDEKDQDVYKFKYRLNNLATTKVYEGYFIHDADEVHLGNT